MPLSEVVIDKRVLEGFKKRALKHYPREFLEIMLGRVDGERVFVYGFETFDHEGDRDTIWVDPESKFNDDQDIHRHAILGTVHTHCDVSPDPSPTDWRNARAEKELIFAVCGIRKSRGGRRFVSWWFGDPVARKQLHLVISE